MRKILSVISVFAVIAVCLMFPYSETSVKGYVFPSSAPDTVTVFSEGFENGFGNWAPLGGGAELKIDTRFSKDGSSSLQVTNRVETWSGPFISTKFLEKNEKYTFDAWVHHDAEDFSTINWILQYETVSSGVLYEEIASESVPPGNWVHLSGTFQMPRDTISSGMYFEAADLSLTFNVDAITVTGKKAAETTASDEEKPEEFNFGFEEDEENWRARGNAKTERSSSFSYLGRYSLYTHDRSKYWNAPSVDISSMVRTGICYEYSAYVMYNERQYENEHIFQIELQYTYEGQELYSPVDLKTLQKGNWSKLCGEFTLPEGASDIQLFIQTADVEEGQEADKNDLMSYYIDNIKIVDCTIRNERESQSRFFNIIIISAAVIILAIFVVIIFKVLDDKNSELSAAARDSMTNTFNRNSYEMQIAHYQNCPDECKKIWITMCDVNFLKTINDNYGHQKGDDAITRCAKLLNRVIGKKGSVFRTGGDEFVCITRRSFTTKLREAFDVETQQYKGYPFSVAVGAACYEPEEDGPEADIKLILARSDKEMYRDKEIQKKNMQGMM